MAEFSGSLYICIVLYLSLHTNYEYLEAIKGAFQVLCSFVRVICAYRIDGSNRYTSQYVNVLANRFCPMCYGKKDVTSKCPYVTKSLGGFLDS